MYGEEMILCMDSLVITILDYDINYVESFCDYMNRYKKEGYKFLGFTEELSLLDFSKDNNNNCLYIITESCQKRELLKGLNNIVILSEDKNIDSVGDIKAIYRYQPSDILLSNILDFCVENINLFVDSTYMKKEKGKLLCFYSPVRRCGKTELAINFSNHLKDKRLLYINLEEFSDIDERLGIDSTYSIGDLLYFIISHNVNFELKLDASIKKRNNFDVIPSMKNIEDIFSLNYEDWNKLYTKIRELGRYDYILLDLSYLSYETIKILKKCDKIIIPYLDNDFCISKLEKFNEYIEEKLDDITEKRYMVNMNNYCEDILNELVAWVSK